MIISCRRSGSPIDANLGASKMRTPFRTIAPLFFCTPKAGILLVALAIQFGAAFAAEPSKVFNVKPAAIASSGVRFDYDLVYIRVPRRTDGKEVRWAEFGHPTNMENGADLMLLHLD